MRDFALVASFGCFQTNGPSTTCLGKRCSGLKITESSRREVTARNSAYPAGAGEPCGAEVSQLSLSFQPGTLTSESSQLWASPPRKFSRSAAHHAIRINRLNSFFRCPYIHRSDHGSSCFRGESARCLERCRSLQAFSSTARVSQNRGKPKAGSGSAAFVSPIVSTRRELTHSD